MPYGLESSVLEQIRSVLVQFVMVEEALLYGSRAKGTHKAGSDIDLCLVGKEVDHKVLSRIDNLLDDLLLPYSFDLSCYHHLYNQELKGHIDRVGIKIYARK
ncbi:MAG: nucleotidyltransferase domain-containing protein [Chlamydiae bacterium]|nr:nucleotidyltransferase domain-containing protein [Chlamydiota bacterium]